MTLLRFLGFAHPLADHLEKELLTKVITIAREKDTTLTNLLFKDWPKEIKLEVKAIVKDLFSVENKKVKQNWKAFKSLIEPEQRESIKNILEAGPVKRFSVEASGERILAMPKDLLRDLTIHELEAVLAPKPEFIQMDPGTRKALAIYAVDVKFDTILNAFESKRDFFKIEYSNYILVEEKVGDYYYVDDDEAPSTKTMLFFSKLESDYAHPKKKEKIKIREAIEFWKQHFKKRPDDRRFYYSDWLESHVNER